MTLSHNTKYLYTVINHSIPVKRSGRKAVFTTRDEVRQYTACLKAQNHTYEVLRSEIGEPSAYNAS